MLSHLKIFNQADRAERTDWTDRADRADTIDRADMADTIDRADMADRADWADKADMANSRVILPTIALYIDGKSEIMTPLTH